MIQPHIHELVRVYDYVIETSSEPDSLGRQSFTLYWLADYHPGDPQGEYRTAPRGQCYFAKVSEYVQHFEKNYHSVTVIEYIT